MAFPTTLPSYTLTNGADTPNNTAGGVGLSGLLNAMEVDITAIGTKLGTGSATPTSNAVLVGNGTGTSTWGTTLGGLTLTTPTIASFVNAQHSHTSSATGGSLGNASVTPSMLATGAATSTVITSTETTASTTYADLTTTTDSVTVTIGANGIALVAVYVGSMYNNTTSAYSYASFAVSGASTIAASDTNALSILASGANVPQIGASAVTLVTSLNSGSNTFKMKYRVSAGTGGFVNRKVVVVPL